MSNPFAPATKRSARARVAFDGPSGSGKTWTSLEWATVLAEGGRVALVDTERGSASLYAARFEFDVIEMQPPYHPQRLTDLIKAAEVNGYAVLVIDSLTHFWSGDGGVLDIVDDASTRAGGNKFAAWKEGSPVQRDMIDAVLAADMHVIVTMRSKQEWVLEENERGKKVPRRVGMAPEQRAGLEYEFTMVGDLDLSHTLVFSKSRCDRLSDVVVKPGEAPDAAETFRSWLDDGEPLADRNAVDGLVQTMNKLPEEVRKACKKAFAERFGLPDRLIASQFEDAVALVGSYELAQDAEDHAADQEQAAGDEPVGEDPPPPDPEPEPAEDGKSGKGSRFARLFALLSEHGISDDVRKQWATNQLDRKDDPITSFSQLTDDDIGRLVAVLADGPREVKV